MLSRSYWLIVCDTEVFVVISHLPTELSKLTLGHRLCGSQYLDANQVPDIHNHFSISSLKPVKLSNVIKGVILLLGIQLSKLDCIKAPGKNCEHTCLMLSISLCYCLFQIT